MAKTKATKTKKKSGGRTASSRTKARSAVMNKSTAKKTGTRMPKAKTRGKMSGDTVALRQQEGIPMSDEIGLVLSFGLMVLMVFSNFGLCGMVGMWLSSFFFGIFGVVQYIMPVAYFAGMTILLANDYSNLAMKKCGAAFVMLMTISGFAQLLYPDQNTAVAEVFSLSVNHRECGGIIGGGLALTLKSGFGTVGAAVILVCIFLLSAILLTQRSLAGFYKNMVEYADRFRAEMKKERALRSEERKQRRAEEAALERESLALTQNCEEEDLSYPVYEEEVETDSGFGSPREYKKKGFFSGMGRAFSFRRRKSARSIDMKVKELENRAKNQDKSAFHFDSKSISRKKTGSVSPVFTASDKILRKDSVRELHPEAYPFTEEDGRTEPFNGELDYSAFKVADRGALEEYIEKNRVKQKEADRKTATGLAAEIRIHTMYDEEDPAADTRTASGPAAAAAAGEPSMLSADTQAGQPDFAIVKTEAEGSMMSAPAVTASGKEERKPAVQKMAVKEEAASEGAEEESSFNYMDAVPADDVSLTPGQALKAVEQTGRTSAGTDVLTESAGKTESQVREARADREETSMASPEIRINRAPEPKALAERKTHQKAQKKKAYLFPPVNLLVREEQSFPADHDRVLKETALKLQETLKSFGVNVTITDISCGPTVTRYEMFPEQGTKVSRIVSLTDDIKLNLAASDIRIEAPIPGKSAIGIEVPNKHNQIVHFRNLIDNKAFRKFKSRLAFAVGKDIGGKIVLTDLARMPHLLIAGATGSGKSVCINTLIMSLIYKASPEEVKMIMVDPKMVELSVYNGIPHLLIPVVTDPKKASGALNWAVSEMTDRYRKFSETGVRNIEGYNKKVKDLVSGGKIAEGELEKMPQIVIIIDELADLMMVSPGEVEDAIVRLSQLARAAGIHLVIATQRPSVNVITGLIKANVPSRIAFAVSSGVDSRTILDMNGAEKLLGKGDMLFYPAGLQKPIRVQGAFITDEEISSVVDFIKEKAGVTEYDEEVTEKIEKKIQSGSISKERDEYFEAAARFIMEKDKATIGMLQRMFKIGFNRAARIIDQLAEAGIIGPEEGTKPRKVLMSPEQLDQYFEEYL